MALRDAAECRELDRVSQKGLLFVIPIVPSTSDAIVAVLGIFSAFSTRYEVPINTTINILSGDAVEMVSSMTFRRTPEGIERAHALGNGLVQEMRKHDVPLMRLDIDSQNDAQIFTQASYRDVLVRLKRLFDPANIIAPGRYIPQVPAGRGRPAT